MSQPKQKTTKMAMGGGRRSGGEVMRMTDWLRTSMNYSSSFTVTLAFNSKSKYKGYWSSIKASSSQLVQEMKYNQLLYFQFKVESIVKKED